MSREPPLHPGQASLRPPDGVVVVDKPSGITSHDVVSRLRRIFGTRRVGHTGTLDPMATGVLLLCLGSATRVAEHITSSRKEYIAGCVLGIATTTQDATGEEISHRDASRVTDSDLRSVLARFHGTILQVPPMVSAVHHEGRRLYELARQGIEVERAPRRVIIEELEVLSFSAGERAAFTLRVACSSGTYIRTLAADIGEAVGVGAMMASLQRTRAGAFSLADALSLEELETRKQAGTLLGTLRPITDALADWPVFALGCEAVDAVGHGRPVALDDGQWLRGDAQEGGNVLLVDRDGAVALAEVRQSHLLPRKVLRPLA